MIKKGAIQVRRFVQCILIYFVSINISSAQTIWKKLYHDSNNIAPYISDTDIDIKYDSINSKYIFLGTSHSSKGWTSVYELSDNGDLLSRNFYGSSLSGSGQTLRFTKDGGAIISDLEINGPKLFKSLLKIDPSYNIVWKYQYDVIISIPNVGLKETFSHELLMAGTTNNGNPFCLKLDSTGNVIRFILFSNVYGYTKFITQCADSNYLIGVNSYQGNGTMLLKIDSTGKVLWSKSYLRPSGYIYNAIMKPNGHIMVIGNTDSTSQTPTPLIFLMELDNIGSTIWCKVYGDNINRFVYEPIDYAYPDPMAFKQTSDGGYIVTSGIKLPGRSIDLALFKTDSLGNIKWERRHGGYASDEEGMNLIQTSDMGYFVVGAYYKDANSQGYYILKTDSLGFAGCEEFTDIIVQNTINPTDSTIIVTDSTIVINVYPATVHDTTDSPPFVDDGCLLNSLTETNINENGLIVYPNPTSGKFHLTFSEDAFKEKDIFIYDMVGNDVYKNAKTTQREIDIDLSKNAKGVYLVKVISDGKVSLSKVVLM